IGSANDAIPGQCLVVVACAKPTSLSHGNVKYAAGSPCGTRREVISSQYDASQRDKPTGRGGAGWAGGGRGRRDPSPPSVSKRRRTHPRMMEPSREGLAGACRVVERPRPPPAPPAPRPVPRALVRLAPEKSGDFEVAVADLGPGFGFGPRIGEPPPPLRRCRGRDRARGARKVDDLAPDTDRVL